MALHLWICVIEEEYSYQITPEYFGALIAIVSKNNSCKVSLTRNLLWLKGGRIEFIKPTEKQQKINNTEF